MQTINTQHATRRHSLHSLKKPLFRFNSFFLVIFIMLLSAAGYSNATEGVFENNISIEGWDTSHETEIPILRFDTNLVENPILNDIKPENMIQDENGSVRFQLSQSTAFGRQVFANVIAIDMGNGMTKNTITHIADGQQTIFLTRNDQLATVAQDLALGGKNTQMLQSKVGDDPSLQCPSCVGGAIVTLIGAAATACASGVSRAFDACSAMCTAGVASFSSGACGLSVTCECQPDIMN